MDIHDYAESDLGGVLALFRQLWPDIEQDPGHMREIFAACRRAGFDMICAVDGERVTGFCETHYRPCLWRQGKLAYMDILVVDRESRRTGVGSAMLAVAWGRARRAGCVYLELDSAFHRDEAHLFYEKHGFERTGFTFGREMAP